MRKPQLAEGDFVRFLNDRLEGRIVRILPGERAVVEIEDGFPVETVFSELVKVEGTKPEPTPQQQPSQPSDVPQLPALPFPLKPGIHLLLVPYTGKVHSGPWQVQLYNTSPTPVLFSLFFDTLLQKTDPVDHGTVSPGQMVHLGDVSGEQKTISCEIALMFHDRSMPDPGRYHRLRLMLPKPGIEVVFPTLESPFSFASSTCVHQFGDPNENTTIDSDKIRMIQEAMSGSGRSSSLHSRPPQTRTHAHELIVDLHIEAISPGHAPRNEKQVIEIQVMHFKKALDRALLDGYPIVYFIHGVGSGILRKAIRKELDLLGLNYSDGPEKRFGQGATMVRI